MTHQTAQQRPSASPAERPPAAQAPSRRERLATREHGRRRTGAAPGRVTQVADGELTLGRAPTPVRVHVSGARIRPRGHDLVQLGAHEVKRRRIADAVPGRHAAGDRVQERRPPPRLVGVVDRVAPGQ